MFKSFCGNNSVLCTSTPPYAFRLGFQLNGGLLFPSFPQFSDLCEIYIFLQPSCHGRKLVCVCVCVYIYIYTHTHTHTHIYIHTPESSTGYILIIVQQNATQTVYLLFCSLLHGYHPTQPHRNSNTRQNKNTRPMWWYNRKVAVSWWWIY